MYKTIIIGIISIILGSCSSFNSSKGEDSVRNTKIDQEFSSLIEKGKVSPIIETTLFGNFKIGISEEEFSKTFQKYREEYKLIKTDEIGLEYCSVDDYEIPASIYTHSYIYISGSNEYYIEFLPEYLNGKLSAMYCSVKSAKKGEGKSLYKKLANEFATSNRGSKFKRWDAPNDSLSYFIKDNLAIMFYPQRDLDESSIQYINLPDEDELNSQREAANLARQSANDL